MLRYIIYETQSPLANGAAQSDAIILGTEEI